MGYGQKRGGALGGSSIVSCEVLHSRGGQNDTRGGKCPSPPPLKYGPDACADSVYQALLSAPAFREPGYEARETMWLIDHSEGRVWEGVGGGCAPSHAACSAETYSLILFLTVRFTLWGMLLCLPLGQLLLNKVVF